MLLRTRQKYGFLVATREWVANVPRVHGRQEFFTDTPDRKQVAETREFPRVTLPVLHMYVRLSVLVSRWSYILVKDIIRGNIRTTWHYKQTNLLWLNYLLYSVLKIVVKNREIKMTVKENLLAHSSQFFIENLFILNM